MIIGAQFDQLYTFTKNAGWRLIFDLSDLFNRNSTNEKLDLSNAKVLIDYASSKGYDLDFELGNGNLKKRARTMILDILYRFGGDLISVFKGDTGGTYTSPCLVFTKNGLSCPGLSGPGAPS